MACPFRANAIDRYSAYLRYRKRLSALKGTLLFSGLFLLFLVLGLSFSFPRSLHAAPLQAGEFQVKAAFLLNFANYVQWPAASLDDDVFIIGILGQDPFGSAADSLKGKTAKGRRVVIKRYDDPVAAREAAILYISGSEKRTLSQILKMLKGRPVLTVGDHPGFAQAGVAINMLVVRKRVNFRINLHAAHQAGMEISSQLLKLAQEVVE
ncbi:MAG: YfiR family protein [Geobacteraceae bacterium]